MNAPPCGGWRLGPGCENRRGFPKERETTCPAGSACAPNACQTTTRKTSHTTRDKSDDKSGDISAVYGGLPVPHVRLTRGLCTCVRGTPLRWAWGMSHACHLYLYLHVSL